MKTLFFSLLLLLSASLNAQTLDQLKKENQKLKEELVITTNMTDYLMEELIYCRSLDSSGVMVSSFNPNFEIKVLSCNGNTRSQEVVLELVYINKITNKQLHSYSNAMFAVDALAKSYPVTTDQYKPILYTGVETRVTYRIKNIMPGTDRFQIISLSSLVTNLNEGSNEKPSNTEIRNVKITWTN